MRFPASLGLLLCAATYAQTEFDVVSIKPSPQDNSADEGIACRDGRFTSYGFPVSFLIRWSYQLTPLRIAGMPGWTTDWNAAYDIEAKAPPPVSLEQCRKMVQQLLATRFQMTSHKEDRKMRAYALVLTDGGSRLRAAHAITTNINGQPVSDSDGALSMSGLAQVLAGHPRVGLPVVDETALSGAIRFDLTFSLRDDDGRPSIFTALQSLGLRLKSTNAPLEVLVIDRIERATPN